MHAFLLLFLTVCVVVAQYTQPFEGPGDQDPALSSLQAGLCSLASIRASESAQPRPIGPLTIGSECFSSATLPSSGIVTIFSATSTTRASSTSAAPSQIGGQENAAPRTAPNWIAAQNITVLLVSTFCLLAAVIYFLDELLELLV